MISFFLLTVALLQHLDAQVAGTYISDDRNYYKLELKDDSTFTLDDHHYDWDLIRYSSGNWSISGDSIICMENKKWYKTSVKIDTSNDQLFRIRFIRDDKGSLRTYDIRSYDSPRKKVEAGIQIIFERQ